MYLKEDEKIDLNNKNFLDELDKKLLLAEENLRKKEKEILQLKDKLKHNEKLEKHLKEGWLTKKGNIIPSWKRRWVVLSGIDHRLYYSKFPNYKFNGMISLRFFFKNIKNYNLKQICLYRRR